MSEDRSETHRLVEPDYPGEVFDSIGLDIVTKGPRLAMCRFNSIQAVLEYNLPNWHSRLLVFLYIGITLGWVKSISSALNCAAFSISVPEKQEGKQSMKTDFKEALAKARKDAKNSLHFCTRVLLDNVWHRKAKVFWALSAPMRLAQGTQAKHNKGEKPSLQYCIDMASGKGLETATEIFEALGNLGALASMGFAATFNELGCRLSEEEREAAIRDEQDWMDMAAKLALALVGRRTLGLEAHRLGFPGRAALLCSGDQKIVDQELKFWHGFAKDWKKLQASTLPAVQRLVKRSFASSAAFDDFMRQLASTKFASVPASLLANLSTGCGISQTLVVENCIKTVRTEESRGQENKQVKVVRRWITPVQRGIVNKVFKYKTVDFSKQVLKGGMVKKKLPAQWFRPKVRDTTLNMKDIVGANKTPTWPTWNAQSQMMQWSDAPILRRCLNDGSLHKLSSHWLSVLCPPGVVFRRLGEAQWRMSLSCSGFTGVLTIKVECHNFAGKQCFSPVLPVGPESLEWVPVMDLDGFEAMRVRWRGPLYKERFAWPSSMPALACEAVEDEAMDLGKLAALSCFYSLGPVLLNRLAKHYNFDIAPGSSLFVLLKTLITNVLTDITDERLLEIMSARVKLDDETNISWDDIDGGDVIGEEDYEEVSKDAEAAQVKEKELLPLKEGYVALHKEVQKKRLSAAPGQKKRRETTASGSASASSSTRNYPMPPLVHELLPKEQARHWLPDSGFKLSKDERNGRWLIYDGYFSVSRSFLKWGEVKAFAKAADAAYKFRCIDCPHPWINEQAAA